MKELYVRAAPWEASGLKGIECHLLCEAAQVIVQENCGIKSLTLSSHIETFLARFLI